MYHPLNVPQKTGKDGLRLNQTHMTQLLEETELLEIVRIKSRRLKSYRDRRLIPYIRTGRSVLYDPDAVIAALKQLERAPVGVPKREKTDKAQEVVAK
jgi:hypothetical protein